MTHPVLKLGTPGESLKLACKWKKVESRGWDSEEGGCVVPGDQAEGGSVSLLCAPFHHHLGISTTEPSLQAPKMCSWYPRR